MVVEENGGPGPRHNQAWASPATSLAPELASERSASARHRMWYERTHPATPGWHGRESQIWCGAAHTLPVRAATERCHPHLLLPAHPHRTHTRTHIHASIHTSIPSIHPSTFT
eukprot:360969-Chlamydomonas_euryale.AAC.4